MTEEPFLQQPKSLSAADFSREDVFHSLLTCFYERCFRQRGLGVLLLYGFIVSPKRANTRTSELFKVVEINTAGTDRKHGYADCRSRG